MSIALKPFAPKSQYILDVSTLGVARTLNRKKFSKNFRWVKKAVTSLLLVVLLSLTLVSAFFAFVSTSGSAKAGAEDLVCAHSDSTHGYLGGESGTIALTIAASQMNGTAGEGLIPITQPKAGSRLTAYEKYTPFLPVFDYWVGVYDNGDDSVPFKGTGGHADGTSTAPSAQGQPVQVTNAKESPLFSHGALDCIGLGKIWGTQFANFIFGGPKVVTASSAELFGFAYNTSITDPTSPLYPLAQAAKALIVGSNGNDGLVSVLYLPFLVPMIMIGAIFLLYVGIVKHSAINAFQSAAWMVGAAIGGVLFLNQPMLIPQASDAVVNAVTSATTTAIISDPQANEYCKLPGIDTATIVREVKCGLWYNTIFTPWVAGQYGVNITNSSDRATAIFTNDPRNILSNAKVSLGSGSYKSAITWPVYQLNNQTINSFNTSEVAYAQLSGVDSSGASSLGGGKGTFKPNGTWASSNSEQPIGAAFLAAIAALGSGLMILVSSFSLVMYQLTMIFLIVLSPLFFLVGAAPGFGRRIAMRWLELIVGLVAKRIIISLVLAVFVKFYTIIISLNSLDYIFKLILVIAITIVGLSQRSKIMSIFTDAIDFGGNKSILDGQPGKGRAILAGLTGAAVAGIGAASGVGAGITAAMVGSVAGESGQNAPPTTASGDSSPTPEVSPSNAPPVETSPENTQPDYFDPRSPDFWQPLPPDYVNPPAPVETSPENAQPDYFNPPAPIDYPMPETSLPIPVQRVMPPRLDAAKITKELRKKAIRQAMIRGAEQGIASGRISGGMVYAASQVGFQTGDTKYDNEVAKLESAGRTFRDQQMLEMFGAQVNSAKAGENEVERRHAEMLEALKGLVQPNGGPTPSPAPTPKPIFPPK